MFKRNTILQVTLRVYLNAVLATISCSFIAVTMMGLFQSVFSDIVYQIVALILFFAFVYSAAWKFGDRDATAFEFDKVDPKDYPVCKGLYAGLLASIPFALTSLFLILPRLGLISDYSAVYRLLNCYLYPINNLLLPATGIMEIGWLPILVTPVLPVLLISIASCIGYLFGLNRISFYNMLVYKKQ